MILEDNIYKAVRSQKRQTREKKKNEGSSKLNSLSSNLKIYIYIKDQSGVY